MQSSVCPTLTFRDWKSIAGFNKDSGKMTRLLTTAAIISCLLSSSVHSQADICYENADILFILDASDCVGMTDFRSQLQFTATLVNNFQVGVTQFSVIRFDSEPDIIFDFDDYRDNAALKNAILNINYTGGGRDTAAALQLARLVAFTSGQGARIGVPRIVILSTCGLSLYPNATAIEAQKLKDSATLVLPIGIGPDVNRQELDAIGTFPADIFQVANYDQLVSIVYDYSESACATANISKCSNRADIYFLLDSSSMITNDLYTTELYFVSNITSKVDLTDTRIGAATFGEFTVRKLFNLGQYTSQYELTQALLSAFYLGGITDTDTALKSLFSQNFFDTASGGRSDAAKILIILTDGGSTSAAQAKVTATQIRAKGINIIAVGVSNPNLWELKDLVNHPVLDVVTNLANPRVAVDRIETLTALQDCRYTMCRDIQFADVIVVVDSSASISDTDYQNELQFVVDLTSKFVLGPDNVRLGAVIFSHDTVKLFDLKDFSSLDPMKIAILSAAHLKSDRDTAKALNFVREQQMFSTNAGGRSNATKVIVLITVGRSNSVNETLTATLRLKSTGVKFIAVGFGTEIDLDELRQVASDDQSLFVVSAYQLLDQIQDIVSMHVCYNTTSLCRDYNLPDGIYPDPINCNQFVECTSLITKSTMCPEDLHFNTIGSVCDDVHVVDCQQNYHYFDHVSKDQPVGKK